MEVSMKKTRLSLFYLAGYLLIGGIGFLFSPKATLIIFLSNGNYSDFMLRIMGVFLLSLFIVVLQIIRRHVAELYLTTLVVRAWLLSAFTVFYIIYRDPMLLVLLAIVGLGVLMTVTSYIVDRKKASG
jgi:uncharacterized protein YjeT (DUF2065 family)